MDVDFLEGLEHTSDCKLIRDTPGSRRNHRDRGRFSRSVVSGSFVRMPFPQEKENQA
jgi:hypothetical protein